MPSAAAQDPSVSSFLLRAVLTHSADAIIEQDEAGRITRWNPAAGRLLGVTEEAVRGQSFAQFIDVEQAGQWRALVEQAESGAPAYLPNMRLQRSDGLTVHAAMSLVPIPVDDGTPPRSCLVVHDQTERRLAQEALADAEERVRRSEALAAVGSFVMDVADDAVQWSEGMFRIFGSAPGSFDGTRDAHLACVHVEDRAAVSAAIEDLLGEGTSAELDHRALVNGRTVWVFLAAEPVVDAAGRVTGVRGVCQDITARKEAEASVTDALALTERANTELRALDAMKDEFLATVSHELRTPLTAIIGFATVLQRTAPQLAAYIQPIARGGADMSLMIEKLLDYSRLQARHVALRAEPLQLARVVDGYLATYAGSDPSQELHNEVPPELIVITDAHALERVVGNLIGNASRYGGEGCTVRVAAEVEADGATLIRVSDDGPGIAAEHLPHLFERFYQVPGTTSSRRGTGLGLAIVREYVTQQGGTVWCESMLGQGSTFFVRLPKTTGGGSP